MDLRHAIAAFAGAVLCAASPLIAQAQNRDDDRSDRQWELLGEKKVGLTGDRDVIKLDQDENWYKERRYRRIRLNVEDNDIYLNRVRLIYFNEYDENLRVDRLIRDGEQYTLRLDGDRGYVRSIELSYRSRLNFDGRATVKIYGELAQDRGRDRVAARDDVRDRDRVRDRDDVRDRDRVADRDDVDGRDEVDGDRRWVELGCRRVSLADRDRDTIDVGKREGWFTAIRLRAEGNDVEVLRVEVVYGNGSPDELDVRRVIRDGGRSRAIELGGSEKSIEQIQLVYRRLSDERGQTRVCADGRLAG